MQIIQSIRDKGAAIVIVVIALSLIGFILMDSRTGSNNAARGSSSRIGKVNGHNIELTEFNKRVTQTESEQEKRSGQKSTSQQTAQIREQVWNQMVAEAVFYDEAKKLGIELTGKEMSSILLSSDQSNPFMQQGFAGQDGKLDVAKAQEALASIKKNYKSDNADAIDLQIIEPLKLQTSATKYGSLINASAYYPQWMADRDAKDNAAFANISYVAVPYTDISDSTVKVTDADIDVYVAKNKELFKQEAGRRISYISFSQVASASDSNKIRTSLEELKAPFQADTNVRAFIAKSASVIQYQDTFLQKAKLGLQNIDTIVKQPQGTVYGPFAEQGLYILARVMGTKDLPDSVSARHILISVADAQSNTQGMDDASAKKLADSILSQLKAGADFKTLSDKYSTDQVAKAKNGDLGKFGEGAMVGEFNTFAFTSPVGEWKEVRTQFGYHIAQVTGHFDFKPAYKIAFIAKEIVPSDATVNGANLAASQASNVKDGKELKAYADKNGLAIISVPTLVKENDFNAGGLTDSRTRDVIRWAFKAKAGEVSEPFDLGDQFVVATVNKIEKEGLQDAATARSGAEVMIQKQKKAAIIKAKLGNAPTLQSASQAYGKQILTAGADSTLTFNSQIISSLGLEPKVIGASFNKAYQAKESPAIDGTNGVYIIKVNSIADRAPEAPEVAAAKNASRLTTIRTQTNNWFEGLRKQADIQDKRSDIY